MNSTELHTRYWRMNSDRRFTTPAAATLYAFLLNWAVQENAPQFRLPDKEIVNLTGISENKVGPVRRELAERHLIEFQTHMGRGMGTDYTVLDFDKVRISADITAGDASKVRKYADISSGEPDKVRRYADIPDEKDRISADIQANEPGKVRKYADINSGPVRENFAQPVVFKSVEVEKVGNLETNDRDESVSAAPFSPTPPIPLPQSILYNSNRVINNNINNITTAPAHTYTHVHVGAGGERVSLTASTLPDYLTLKGYLPERVGEFVDAHPDQAFTNKMLLTVTVRHWLADQKKAGVIVTTKGQKTKGLTLDERIAKFRAELYAWRNHTNNTGKYEDWMYKNFFDYWTEHKPGASTMRHDRETDFDIGKRLATSYQRIWLPELKRRDQHGTNTTFTSNTKRPVDFQLDTALANAAESGYVVPDWAAGEAD